MEAEAHEVQVCERVGKPMPDIAGIGIIVAFTGQAFLSLLVAAWVFFLSKHGRLDLRHEEDSDEHRIEAKRLELFTDILMVGNDIQMLTGICLMITAFVLSDTIDLYHLHLIYDTVSFVGVSNAAALVTWTFCQTKHPTTMKKWNLTGRSKFFRHLTPRHRITYIFAMMFLALAITLGVRLNDWSLDPSAPLGSCFRTTGVTSMSASHPGADKTYVGITASWLLLVLFAAVLDSAKRRHFILVGAFAQFPLHLYMVIALRTNNQGAHEGEHEGGGNAENEWDFGQTAAVLLLGVAINEMVSKVWQLWRFEKGVKKGHRAETAIEGGTGGILGPGPIGKG